MAIFHGNAIPSVAEPDYPIDNSCRFDNATFPYMVRTPVSSGNRQIYTISVWVKLGHARANGDAGTIFAARTTSSGFYNILEVTGNKLHFINGSPYYNFTTAGVMRDESAWYHIHLKLDTTQLIASERMKIYINGVEPATSSLVLPSQNDSGNINASGVAHYLGAHDVARYNYYFDGLMSEFHFVDGTALDPASFGEFDATYGHWKPIEVTGLTYGTNGFYMDFKDSSNLGNDVSGNTNDYALTSIAASDQMTDTPTNNFSTLNGVWQYGSSSLYGTLSEGNLKTAIATHGPHTHPNTIPVSSGKWYWEVQIEHISNNAGRIGICTTSCTTRDGTAQAKADTILLRYDGMLKIGTGGVDYSGYSTSFGTSTKYILSFILNLDDNEIEIKVDGVTGGGAKSIPAGEYEVMSDFMSSSGSTTQWYNWGQDGTFAGTKTAAGNADGNGYGNFYYAPPSGFLALCTKNLSNPAVVPSEHFNTVLYTGNGATNTVANVGFQPDFAWLKNRTHASYQHELYDSVRGVTKILHSNATTAEYTEAVNSLTAFNSDGFVLTGNNYSNRDTSPYVAWNWKANGSGSSNEDGTINTTSTSANVAAGFSISTYTGTGSNATVGHGLAVAPTLVIVKRRSATNAWQVGTLLPAASLDFTDQLVLNTTGAADTTTGNWWNNTAPTASVFSIGSNDEVNASTNTFVAYCWHSVEGYSKVGSYTGNGNADGPFIYTGFRPAFVITKYISSTGHWRIKDNKRDTYNKMENTMWANDYSAEQNENDHDWCANGFKIRNSGAQENASGGQFLYMAFAETPFKHANAR